MRTRRAIGRTSELAVGGKLQKSVVD